MTQLFWLAKSDWRVTCWRGRPMHFWHQIKGLGTDSSWHEFNLSVVWKYFFSMKWWIPQLHGLFLQSIKVAHNYTFRSRFFRNRLWWINVESVQMWIEDVMSFCSFRYFSTVVISNSNFRLDQCYLSFFRCTIIIIVRFMGLWLNNDSDNRCFFFIEL